MTWLYAYVHNTDAAPAGCLSVPPTLRSSVDGYKIVCPGEEVHFVCSVQNSNLLTWKSTEYIGRNAVIEFNQNFNRLGEGKSTSLPNRETTLLQLSWRTNQELKATLRIVIVSSVVNASNLSYCWPYARSQSLTRGERVWWLAIHGIVLPFCADRHQSDCSFSSLP